ncbi:hypothetical protein ACWDZ8_28570 [Streptomyces sp. NPDC003233]
MDALSGGFADHQRGTGAGQGQGIEAAAGSLSARHEQMGGLNARSWSLTRSQQMPLNGCGGGVLAANRRTLSRHTAV